MIFLLVIIIKSFAWPFAGPFLIVTYTTLSLVFSLLSWLIYTYKDKGEKRLYFKYGTIPFGIAISTLLLMTIAKLQHWPWYDGAFKVTLLFFFIVALIFIIAFILTKNTIKKDIIKQLMFKTFVFIGISITVICIDFDKIISALSSKEVNEQREQWRIESQKANSIYQNN